MQKATNSMILQAYERVWIELNRAALVHNIVQLQRAIYPALLAPVIKCNAYGHGLIPISRVCDERPEVHMLCVAFLSEALYLRHAGITKPILVMSYCDDDLAKAVNANIAIVVDSYEELYAINNIGTQHAYRFDIHLKIDTGLVRRGIQPMKIVSFIATASVLPYIRVTGICSHFASAYTPHSVQTVEQIEIFTAVINALKSAGVLPSLVHMSNSSLIPVEGCSMLRVGLALYGYCALSTGDASLGAVVRPVLSLKSRIVSLRSVNKDVCVGYDGLSITLRPTMIALVPIGYADGYDMRFSLCCCVQVRGMNVPLLGRVGMNSIAIDVTDITDVAIGDEVLLIGDKQGVRVSDLIACVGMKNAREVLARLNPSMPRYVV